MITRLMATVYTDIVGYSRLFACDAHDTVARLHELHRCRIAPDIERLGGRVAQTGGDSMVLLFDTVLNAVQAAVRIQRLLALYNERLPGDRAIQMRIGIDLGDIMFDETNFHGDGVIIAARLQALCPPRAICVSQTVYDRGASRLGLRVHPLGSLTLKNVPRPVEAYVLWPEAERLHGSLPSAVA